MRSKKESERIIVGRHAIPAAMASFMAVSGISEPSGTIRTFVPEIREHVPNRSDVSIGEETSSKTTDVFAGPEEPSEWNTRLEREFDKLAIKEAAGEASKEDLSRLDYLSSLRRQLNESRTAEDVLREIKQERIYRNLQNALREYVEFVQGKD